MRAAYLDERPSTRPGPKARAGLTTTRSGQRAKTPHFRREATIDTTLLALADPVRRAIVDQLRDRERRATELAESLRVSRPVMSKHLKVLRTNGLVDGERGGKDARERIFRLRPEPFAELRGWIEQVELFWTRELAAFKAHVEGKRR